MSDFWSYLVVCRVCYRNFSLSRQVLVIKDIAMNLVPGGSSSVIILL